MNDTIKIAKSNGLRLIKAKLLEEVTELKEALESNIEPDIIEELADVLVVSDQFIWITNNAKLIKEWKRKKIDRTKRRKGIK